MAFYVSKQILDKAKGEVRVHLGGSGARNPNLFIYILDLSVERGGGFEAKKCQKGSR